MKNILIAFVLLLSFQINAQIPDSLEIDLPWETVYLPNCDASMGEGPTTENNAVAIFLELDTTILNENNECILRERKWIILDWLGAGIYEFIQIGQIETLANTQCETDIYIKYEEFPLVLSPGSLLLDLDPSHKYSFSFSDENYNSILIDGTSDDNLDLYVYDFTDNTICKSNIYLTSCEDDIVLEFPESVEVEFNQEPYIDLTLEMLGVNIVYPCGSYDTKITVNNTSNSVLASQNVGNIVPVKVVVEFTNGVKYIKYINVNVIGVKPPPISMFIEEVDFTAGQTIELDIWSEEVLGLIAWQLQLQFENAEILGLETSEMFDDIPSNIMDEGKTLRALWFPSNGEAFDAESNATWYTIIVKPEIDGSTFDIFSTSQGPWSKIAIEDENYIYEYEADFVFNVAPRNILSVNASKAFANIDVFPNPCSDVINLKGMTENATFSQIEILDLSGKIMQKETIQNSRANKMVDVSSLPSGLFILKIRNGETMYTQKIIKI